MNVRVITQKNNTKQTASHIDHELKRIIKSATFGVEGYAKTYVPVDTGNLKNSIQGDVSASGLTGTVSTNVEYAAYVEMGTVNTPAQPYMRPAMRAIMPKLRAALRQIGMGVR